MNHRHHPAKCPNTFRRSSLVFTPDGTCWVSSTLQGAPRPAFLQKVLIVRVLTFFRLRRHFFRLWCVAVHQRSFSSVLLILVERLFRLCTHPPLCFSSQRPTELGIGGLVFVIIRQALWCVGGGPDASAALSPEGEDHTIRNSYRICEGVSSV